MNTLKVTALALALVSTTAMANVTETVEDGKKVITTTKTVKPLGVGLELSSLGYGANVAWGVNDTVELQAGWNGFNIKDVNTDINGDIAGYDVRDILPDEYANLNINLRGDAKFSNPYIGLQTRPFKGAFTVGTGIIVPQQDVNFTLTANANGQNLPINGTNYPLNQGDSVSLSAESKHQLAPYVTVGLRPRITSRFGVSAELGVAYMGKYAVNINVQGDRTDPTRATVLDQISTELNKKVDNGENIFVPIAKLGATVRF